MPRQHHPTPLPVRRASRDLGEHFATWRRLRCAHVRPGRRTRRYQPRNRIAARDERWVGVARQRASCRPCTRRDGRTRWRRPIPTKATSADCAQRSSCPVESESRDEPLRSGGLDEPRRHRCAGRSVVRHQRRGTESATFRYDDGWLADRRAYPIDPLLPLTAGSVSQTAAGRAVFGAFSDCAPDRWGRRLITRRERRRADRGWRGAAQLLRVRLPDGRRDDGRQAHFASAGQSIRHGRPEQPAPPPRRSPRLLNAARRVEEEPTRRGSARALRAGSSLGGPAESPRPHTGRAARHRRRFQAPAICPHTASPTEGARRTFDGTGSGSYRARLRARHGRWRPRARPGC